MGVLFLVAGGALVLALAYRTYGEYLFRWLRTDDRPTPAVARQDNRDYVPAGRTVVLGQHFTAIAAAGPIVGPILAGVHFGWLPALLWILAGSIFIGGAHDLAALFASLRHNASSIAQVVREGMSRRAYLVFLLFIWLSLLYVIIAFTDLTASSFARDATFAVTLAGENVGAVNVSGGGVATAAAMYLGISVVLGLAMRRGGLPTGAAGALGCLAVGLAIWYGQDWPLPSPSAWLGGDPQRGWNLLILAYCFLASVLPMWLLLQPRGLLGAIFLYAVILSGVGGVLIGGLTGEIGLHYPAFRGFDSAIGPLLPFLFISVACGACSGFHSIVCSGTTSKQLRCEADVKPVAYGAMLLEGLLAVLALTTVMILTPDQARGNPDAIFAQGVGRFLAFFGIPFSFAVTFGLLAFSTFIFDTLDVCTRLGRYVFQELTGWQGRWAGAGATLATLAFPVLYLSLAPPNAWRQFWVLFGTSNQLLAALTLIGLTVWFHRLGRNPWPVLGPALFMLGMTSLALLTNLWNFGRMLAGVLPRPEFLTSFTLRLNFGIALLLAALTVLVAGEAARLLRRPARISP